VRIHYESEGMDLGAQERYMSQLACKYTDSRNNCPRYGPYTRTRPSLDRTRPVLTSCSPLVRDGYGSTRTRLLPYLVRPSPYTGRLGALPKVLRSQSRAFMSEDGSPQLIECGHRFRCRRHRRAHQTRPLSQRKWHHAHRQWSTSTGCARRATLPTPTTTTTLKLPPTLTTKTTSKLAPIATMTEAGSLPR
jgi:hypothetical protein